MDGNVCRQKPTPVDTENPPTAWPEPVGPLRGARAKLRPLADNKGLHEAFLKAKRDAKRQFVDWLHWSSGQIVDEPQRNRECADRDGRRQKTYAGQHPKK
jgi:hypothetical protein